MNRTTAERRDGTLFGHAAQRLTLTCPHGTSTEFVLPGRDPKADLAVVDLLWLRHTARNRCECRPARPGVDVS